MKAFLTKLALAITLGIGLTLAALAQGSDRCVSTDQIIDLLASRYGEEQVASGVVGGGAVLLIFAHPDGSTWSAVVVLPDGRACMMASGTGWATRPPTPAGSET